MKYLKKLDGFQRSPAGLEWQIWQRLHVILAVGNTEVGTVRELEARIQAKCGCNCHELCKVPDENYEEHKTCAECFKVVCDENRAMEDRLDKAIDVLDEVGSKLVDEDYVHTH
mgnify:CR=1 FL=1